MGLETSLYQRDGRRQNDVLRSFLSASGPKTARKQDQLGTLTPVAPAAAAPMQFLATSVPQVTPAAAPQTPSPIDMSKVTSSYSYDPVLAQMHAASASDLAQAENTALEGKRNLLLAYGDKKTASGILGEKDPTIAAINEDPEQSMSTLARIARAYQQAVTENEQSLNDANLFYGGYRGDVLKRLSQQRTEQESDASTALQDALRQIGAALLAKKNEARDRELAARETSFRDRLANWQGAGSPTDMLGNPLANPADAQADGGFQSYPGTPHPVPDYSTMPSSVTTSYHWNPMTGQWEPIGGPAADQQAGSKPSNNDFPNLIDRLRGKGSV